MTQIKKYLLSLLIVVSVSECVQAKSRTSSTSSQISDLSRKLGRLEQKVSTLQRDVDLMKKTNGKLTNDLKIANDEIQQVTTRNEGLQHMLSQFEKFFGKLYSDSDAFGNPAATSVDKKINIINGFIGDKEASLIEANPNYMYTVMGVDYGKTETNVTDELVQSAVLQMATENKEMQQKVDNLEARVVEASKSKSSGASAADIALTNDRLNKLEDMMAVLVTDNHRTAARTVAEQKEFDELLENALFSGRSVSSTRKSVFSVSRTSNLYGGFFPQVITFDHTFVNKGGDFVPENGTFICQWTGYYFFTVTLRTHDDHYIGVTVMKTAFETGSSELVTAIYTDADSRNTMETQSIALHLKTGDEVWLRLGPSDRYAITSDAYRYITFTGFLVYKGN